MQDSTHPGFDNAGLTGQSDEGPKEDFLPISGFDNHEEPEEERLPSLGGFVYDADTKEEDLPGILGSSIDEDAPLVDAGTFDEQTDQPKTPIYKSIPLKAGLAGFVMLFVVLPMLGLFSGNLISSNSDGASTGSTIDEPVETEEEAARRELEEDNANLRRQLALQNQEFTAADMEAEAASVEGNAALSTSSPSNIRTTQPAPARVATAPSSRPAPPAPPPPRPVVTRSVSPPRRVAPPSPLRAVEPSRPAITSRPPAPVVVSASDLSNNGNYGSLPQTAVDSADSGSRQNDQFFSAEATLVSSTIPVSVATKATSASSEPVRSSKRQQRLPATQERNLQVSISDKDSHPAAIEVAASYEEERALILGGVAPTVESTARPVTIAPGSLAQGELSQPISWTSDMSSVRGALTLTAPLMSDGYEVLPAGTQFIVEVANFSESGAVELRPTAIVLSQESGLDLSIPLDAIQILAADGGYPIAQVEDGSEQALRRIDRQQAVLGALSGAARFINRPNSESGFLGAGGSTYNRDYGEGGSVIAAIGGGAADEILNARSQRLAAQGARIAERPYIWTLPAGAGVQIFIAQEVQL